jgi:hypothetical protein
MNLHLRRWLAAVSLLVPGTGLSEVMEDWGTVFTPIESETSFSFEQYDVDKNFTHDYLFSLEGDAGATYEVTFHFDSCTKGCGNPDLAYGIYDASGGLYSATSGTVLLSAGSYTFQVKGTGMGAGNSVDYWGDLTFSATLVSADSIVAPVPEPATLTLSGAGAMVLGWAAYRRRRNRSTSSGEPANSGAC